MTVLGISQLNRGWGICGFASSLAALHQNGVIGETIDRAVMNNQLKTRLLAEIKSYLVILQSENQSLLLDEITKFTRAFKGFEKFTIQGYINNVNGIALSDPKLNDSQFSIAMPPSAVCDYLRRVGGLRNVQLIDQSAAKFDNVILGLGDGDQRRIRWKGLGHWVYKKSNAVIYNWGKQENLAQLMAHNSKWKIVYQILLRK